MKHEYYRWVTLGSIVGGGLCFFLALAPDSKQSRREALAPSTQALEKTESKKKISDEVVVQEDASVKKLSARVEKIEKTLGKQGAQINRHAAQLKANNSLLREVDEKVSENRKNLQSLSTDIKKLLARSPVKKAVVVAVTEPEPVPVVQKQKPEPEPEPELQDQADQEEAAQEVVAQKEKKQLSVPSAGRPLGKIVINGNAFAKNASVVSPTIQISLRKRFEAAYAKALSQLNNEEKLHVSVQGHASPEFNSLPVSPEQKDTVAYKFNYQIAEERALAIRNYLDEKFLQNQIHPYLLSYKSFSHSTPIEGKGTVACGGYDCEKSRRVEIVFGAIGSNNEVAH